MPESPLTEAATELAKEVAKREGKDSKRPLWVMLIIGISPALATGFFSYRTSKVEAEAKTKQQAAELHLAVDATYGALAASVNSLHDTVRQTSEDIKQLSSANAKMQGQLEELEKLSLARGWIKKAKVEKVIKLGEIPVRGSSFAAFAPVVTSSPAPSMTASAPKPATAKAPPAIDTFLKTLGTRAKLPTNADVVINAYKAAQAVRQEN